MSCTTPVALALALLVAPPLPAFAQPSGPEAEQLYQRFLTVYRDAASTRHQLQDAKGWLEQAHTLAPTSYKYSFGLGAVSDALADYGECVRWYTEAEGRAASPAQRDDAVVARESCRVSLARATYRDRPPEVEVAFTMKVGSVEMGREQIAALPRALPEVAPGGDTVPLHHALQAALPGLHVVDAPPFVVAGWEPDANLTRYASRGFRDHYRELVHTYFPDGLKRPVVVVLSEDVGRLLDATHRLYPDQRLPRYAPFLGYYNPADRLIMANSGRAGYGTLLHELVHALVGDHLPGAPPWFDEGLASLYERTAWVNGHLRPTPNWRMTFLREDKIPALDTTTRAIAAAPLNGHTVALTRLLFLFLQANGRMDDLCTRLAQAGPHFALNEAIAPYHLSDVAWRAFVHQTFHDYHLEVAASRSTLSNPEEVRYIQHALNKALGSHLPVDGIWGPATAAKLIELQRTADLTPDGILGPKTRAELRRRFALPELSR